MDTGKIKADLESAFREALFSSRLPPAKPGAGSSEGHEANHPRQNGVIVNLTSTPREGVRAAQQQIAEARASLPLEIAGRANVGSRDSVVMAKALQTAHAGDAGKAAQVLTRIQEHSAQIAGAAQTQSAQRTPLPLPADTRASAAPNAPGAPIPPPRLPIEMASRETAPTREAEVLARAMRVAHSGPAATVAQVLGRAEERLSVNIEAASRHPAEAASTQAAPARSPGVAPQPQALPANPLPDASARIDPHAAQAAMVLTAAMTASQSAADPAKAAFASSAPRTHPELITPMLVRQQPPEEAPAPYLNQIIIGAAFLGLVVLLVM